MTSLVASKLGGILSKRELISSFLEDSKSDVIAFTETWLHSAIKNDEIFSFSNMYDIYRCDHSLKRGGSVLIGVKKAITSFLVNTNSDLEIIWVACTISSSRILIGNRYRAPDCNSSFINALRDTINKAIELFPADSVYLLGDFNYPLIDWAKLSSPCHTSSEFINLSLDFNLFQAVTKPTRGSNVLDLLLSTAPETIGHIEYLDGFSDHHLLQITINITPQVTGVTRKQIRDYNKGNYSTT